MKLINYENIKNKMLILRDKCSRLKAIYYINHILKKVKNINVKLESVVNLIISIDLNKDSKNK